MTTTKDDSSHLLDFIVDRVNVGIFAINSNMEIMLWNRFMETHSGQSVERVKGKNLFECFPELPKKWLERKIKNVFILKNFSFTSWEQRPFLFEFPHNRPVTGGIDSMRQDCTLMPVKDDSGEVKYICFTLFDVTDTSIYQTMLKEVMLTLEEASNKDGLTNIFNRRFIEENLNKEYTRSFRYNAQLSIIILDIDHFKKINDNYGHLGGDEVLRIVSKRISETLRKADSVGRYGGEEFLIVLPETDGKGAMVLAERLREYIAGSTIQYDNTEISATISLGVAELHPEIQSYEAFINEADRALYHSKETGRNRATYAGDIAIETNTD